MSGREIESGSALFIPRLDEDEQQRRDRKAAVRIADHVAAEHPHPLDELMPRLAGRQLATDPAIGCGAARTPRRHRPENRPDPEARMTTATEPTTEIALPTVDDIAYTLAVAATVIQTNGLMKGDLYDADAVDNGALRAEVRVCAVGAIHTAVAGTPVLGLSDDGDLQPNVILADMARAALGQHIGYAVPAWNDNPGRTADDVVTALRATADQLRGRA